MIILSPKNQLQLHFGKTTKLMSLSSPLSGITHNGCTRDSIGTVTNEMLTSVPNCNLTKKIFPLDSKEVVLQNTVSQYPNFLQYPRNQVFFMGSDFQSLILGCSLLENEQVPNHTIVVLGSKGVHRTVHVLLMLM
jgi:hypothetical protein